MASRPARGKKSDVSYAEVESHVDLSDSDRPSGKSAAKTEVSKKKKGKKSKRARVTAPFEEKEGFSVEPFLNMPLDILAEICTHLSSTDLLELAHSARVFRSLLLSFRTFDLAEELPLLNGMSELQFAVLLYGTVCFDCGAWADQHQRDLLLRTRRCKGCRKSALVIRKKVPKALSPLHPSLLKCAMSTPTWPNRTWRKHEYYVVEDLMEINDELLELQEYDDVTEARREAAKLKKGTNSRQRALPEDLREDQISRVDQFVEEKSCAVSERVKEIKELEVALAQAMRREEEFWKQRRTMHAQLIQARQTSEIEANVVPAFTRERSDHAERLIMDAGRALRLLIKPYYSDFNESNDVYLEFPFPTFGLFCGLAAVEPFWSTPDSTIDAESWALAESTILEERRAKEESLPQRVIDLISTSTGSPPPQLADLTVKAQKQFFARVTSLFVQSPWGPSRLVPFPRILFENLTYEGGWSLCAVERATRANSVLVFRAILEAAGRDDTATTDELDDLGALFTWKENHGKNGASRVYEWRGLVWRIFSKYYTRRNLTAPTITLVDSSLAKGGPADDEELEDSDDGGGDDALPSGKGSGGDDSGSEGVMEHGGRLFEDEDEAEEEGSDGE